MPYLGVGNLLFLTGQLCHRTGERRLIGKLGTELDVEQGQDAARICGLNLVAQLKAALEGDLGRVVKTVRLARYVSSTPDFHGQSQVVNGASGLFVDLFGDAGRHTRLAVGVSALHPDWDTPHTASGCRGNAIGPSEGLLVDAVSLDWEPYLSRPLGRTGDAGSIPIC